MCTKASSYAGQFFGQIWHKIWHQFKKRGRKIEWWRELRFFDLKHRDHVKMRNLKPLYSLLNLWDYVQVCN